jgi:hypothetical protein
MIHATFEQRRVAIIGAERQGYVKFRHSRNKYRNLIPAVNVSPSALMNSLVNHAVLQICFQRRNARIGNMQFRTLSLLVFFAFALLARSAVVAETAKVHVSAPSRSLTWFPAHLTRQQGFYRAEGLEVDFIVMKPQVALQALIAGDVGYTTALGSTMRAGIRGLPLRVVMTIAEKPLFALMARPGINSVEELKGKLLGVSSRDLVLVQGGGVKETDRIPGREVLVLGSDVVLRGSQVASPVLPQLSGVQLVQTRMKRSALDHAGAPGKGSVDEGGWPTLNVVGHLRNRPLR